MVYARLSVADTAVLSKLLDAIGARNLEGIAGCFAAHARLRALTPHELRVEDGPEEIAARSGAWLGSLESFAVTSSDVERIADRVRVRYRFHGRDPEQGWQENEHTACAPVVGGRIAALNVSCAGFRPAEPPR